MNMIEKRLVQMSQTRESLDEIVSKMKKIGFEKIKK